MKEYVVKILMIEFVTHDVKRFIVEKPSNFSFVPGQANEVSINTPELASEKRPFTFTSMNSDDVLEFTIKVYQDHNGFTKKLGNLKPGDELIIREPWGTIKYNGPGVFIAGGAGLTPFIAILRDLKNKNLLEGNTLLFSNKTWKDIILERELKEMLGDKAIFTLTEETLERYEQGRITREFLKRYVKDFDQQFYICGPPKFVAAIKEALGELGANTNNIVIEL